MDILRSSGQSFGVNWKYLGNNLDRKAATDTGIQSVKSKEIANSSCADLNRHF